MQTGDGHSFAMAIVHGCVDIVHPLQYGRRDGTVVIGDADAGFVAEQALHVVRFEIDNVGGAFVIFKRKSIGFDVESTVRYDVYRFDRKNGSATRGK